MLAHRDRQLPENPSILALHPHAGILLPLDRRELQEILRIMRAASPVLQTLPTFEVYLITDQEIAFKNREFLGCSGPTNILTFPGDADLPGTLLLSLDCWQRECHLYGQHPLQHFLQLLAHGCAHLCGLDHGIQFAEIENRCLAAAMDYVYANKRF